MYERLTTSIYHLILAFTAALLAWILLRSGNVAVLVAAAVAAGLAWFLPRSSRPAAMRVTGAWRRIASAGRGGHAIAAVAVALALGLRMWWAFHHHVEQYSDFEAFWNSAVAFSRGDVSALGPTKSPLTVLIYGVLFRIFGAVPATVYVLNAVLGAMQVALVYAIGRRLSSSTAPAALAAVVLAVYPSVVSYYGWVNSEVLFFTFFLLVVWQMLRWSGGRAGTVAASVTMGILVGVEIAAMHYARNVGVVFGAWVLAAALVWTRRPAPRRLLMAAVAAVTLSACLVPQVVYNYRTFGYISIQSSKWGSLNLLSGTNVRARGRHNRFDVGWLQQRHGLDDKGWAAASRDMRRIALERIKKDPAGFLAFALTDKFDVMWCDDGFGAVSVMERERREGGPYDTWKRRSDRFYFALVALALAGLLGGTAASTRRLFVVMSGGALLLTFALHLFIEVQPRYHFIMAFTLPLFSGMLLDPPGRDDDQSLM